MRKQTIKLGGACLAALALAQASIAQAQEACVEPADINDALVYVMPGLVGQLKEKCSTALPADSFLMSDSEAWVSGFRVLSEESWPGTKRFFMTFGKAGGNEGFDMSELPDETLRPLFDAIIPQVTSDKLKLDTNDCSKVNDLMELLSPLPPRNAGGLLSIILELAKSKDPAVCPREGE